MSTTLTTQIYLSPYKPIPASVPGWDPGRQATWPATTATLIDSGEQAILVDSLMTRAEGAALSSWIAAAAGRRLSTIYVTHAHADHFFGATTVLEQFPAARLVALPDVATAAAEQAGSQYLEVWNSFFPGQISESPAAPVGLRDSESLLAGHTVELAEVGHSDVPISTVVHLPELDTVICGDVAYNGIHMWLQGSSHTTRQAWTRALDAVERLSPRTIIVGHKDPDAPDDDANRVLDESRGYLSDFDRAVAADATPAAIIDAMLAKYGALGNPYTLWVAAHGLAP